MSFTSWLRAKLGLGDEDAPDPPAQTSGEAEPTGYTLQLQADTWAQGEGAEEEPAPTDASDDTTEDLPEPGTAPADPVELEPVTDSLPPEQPTWCVLAESVTGPSHVRSGLPNQDAVHVWTDDPDEARHAVVAIADGHGNEKAFRSEFGSRFAVNVTVEILRVLLNEAADVQDLSKVKSALATGVPREIVQRWTEAVEEHLREIPVRDEELARWVERTGSLEEVREAVASKPLKAYGATLLAVGVCPRFIVCLQIGDGAILGVDGDGESFYVVEDDESLVANATTSLSGRDAVDDFRCRLQVLAGHPPSLLLVSTDGFVNAMPDALIPAIAGRLFAGVRRSGIAGLRAGLHPQLERASRASADDTTVAVLVRLAALDEPYDEGPSTAELRTEAETAELEPTTEPAGAEPSEPTTEPAPIADEHAAPDAGTNPIEPTEERPA